MQGCVIDPESKWKIRFDIYIMFVMIFTAIFIPWRLAFYEEDDMVWTIINLMIDLSFLVDIILTFFTAYFDDVKLRLVTNKKDLAWRYIKSCWFFIDVLSIFPFEQVLKADGNG